MSGRIILTAFLLLFFDVSDVFAQMKHQIQLKAMYSFGKDALYLNPGYTIFQNGNNRLSAGVRFETDRNNPYNYNGEVAGEFDETLLGVNLNLYHQLMFGKFNIEIGPQIDFFNLNHKYQPNQSSDSSMNFLNLQFFGDLILKYPIYPNLDLLVGSSFGWGYGFLQSPGWYPTNRIDGYFEWKWYLGGAFQF